MFRKITEVQSDLQAIANQKGAKGFDAAKAAYLDSVVVTDDDGKPLSPDAIQFDITMPAEKSASQASSIDEDSIRRTIRDEIAKSARPQHVAKAVQISQPDVTLANGERYNAARGKAKFFSSTEKAHDFGMFVAAALGHDEARSYCSTKGLRLVKGQTEGSNTAGGFLVPEQFEPDLIRLREMYGTFRANARIIPMSRDYVTMPRQTSAHTVYFAGEATAGTESTAAFDRVGITAKKAIILNTTSNEFSEDSAIAWGDIWANDVSYAMGQKEDDCGWNGTGTSTYGGMVGVTAAFDALGTEANSAGVYSATVAWTSVTMADIQAWMALLPAYAAGPQCKFYCHKAFYHNVLERLAFSAGGTTTVDIKNGVPVQTFMGYDVVFVQVLPNATATTQYDAYFGDLSRAAYFGDRRGITISTSDSALNAFEQDEIAWRATERFGITVANVGNNNATAASRVAGPLVAWYRAS